jgi:hypothetical protein
MSFYHCDSCDRLCSRIHRATAYGMEGSFCDACYGYDPEAYDEPPDHVLAEQARWEGAP